MKNPAFLTALLRPRAEENRLSLRLFCVVLAVFVLMSALKPSLFPTAGNLSSMATQFPEYGVMAIGVSLTMISGGIDLAVVGIANLSAVAAAKFLVSAAPRGTPAGEALFPVLCAIAFALAIGVLCGAFSGALISCFRIPPILATLGAGQLFGGAAIVLTAGRPISGMHGLFLSALNTEIAGFLPLPFVLYALIACAVHIVLTKSTFGIKLFLLGANPKAALYAGLANRRIILTTYMISGALAAAAGLIMTARTNSAKADYGSSYTLQCVLIAVLGGVDPAGGRGSVLGVTFAVLILQFLSSGLNMFDTLSNFYRDVIWGAVLILALIANWQLSRRKG
ncbi:MAG: ABC transporter permease [Spirochaetaceae bacterium]|jgi:simple sugar transport system permease protein|nr:ABC transporter permease [Spirochaetaceae bacterium]